MRVGLDLDIDVEIAGRRVAWARHALTGYAQALLGIDAGGHVDQHLALLFDRALAATGFAGRRDHLPGAATARTRAGEHDEPALRRDLAGPAALIAGLGLGARLGAAAVARLARRGAVDRYLVLAAGERLGQRQR